MRPMTLPAKWAVAVSFLLATACSIAPETTAPAGEPNAARDAHMPQQIAEWFERSSPEVLALPQTVFADNDEWTNQLVFGVEHSGVNRGVEMVLSRLGIPASAYRIVVTPPIVRVNSLQALWASKVGGIQIHFPGYLCTMGFYARSGTEDSFITNSHCTTTQGGVEDTPYWQPLSSVNSTVIGVEVDDPLYTKCSRGRVCRSSDAARVRYNSGVGFTPGLIAKTSGPNNYDLNANASFSIASQDNNNSSFSGTVNKVGRTTGWTTGTVTNSCANVNVSGSNVQQRCQTIVYNSTAMIVGGGDSGSPVFTINDGTGTNVTLVGILWGGSGDGHTFVFSPLKNIQDELGGLTATASGTGGGDPGDGGGTEQPPCVPRGKGNNCK